MIPVPHGMIGSVVSAKETPPFGVAVCFAGGDKKKASTFLEAFFMAKEIEALLEEAAQAHISNVARMDELEARMNRERIGADLSAGPVRSVKDELKLFYNVIGRGSEPITDELVNKFKNYDQAFNQYLVRGDKGLSPDILNTLSVGSDPGGGYFVTPTRSQRIIQKLFETSPVRANADYVPLTVGDSLEIIQDIGEAEAEWVGETQSRADTGGIEFAKVTIPLHEIYAQPKATQKLLDTAGENLEAIINNRVAKAFARKEGNAFVVGNAVSKPRGFLDYEMTNEDDDTRAWGKLQYVPTGASGDFVFDSGLGDDAGVLFDVVSKLKTDYRPNAKWYMNRATAAVIRKMRDGNGRYLWVDGLQAGQPNRLLGYEVVEMEDMPDIAADANAIAFGDMREAYVVTDMPSIRILRDPFTSKPYVKFYTYFRVGGGLQNSDALKVLRFSAG